jgi:hypothetical protein
MDYGNLGRDAVSERIECKTGFRRHTKIRQGASNGLAESTYPGSSFPARRASLRWLSGIDHIDSTCISTPNSLSWIAFATATRCGDSEGSEMQTSGLWRSVRRNVSETAGRPRLVKTISQLFGLPVRSPERMRRRRARNRADDYKLA